MNILIGTPSTGNGTTSGPAIYQALQEHRDWNISYIERSSSLLTRNHNMLWATMLNHRKAWDLDWYLNLHADVRPYGENWLGRLIAEAMTHEAKVLSAIIPIKNGEQKTSTALEDPQHLWSPTVLTVQESLERPLTWTDRHLLVNTGCLLVRVREGHWQERICFTIRDRIRMAASGRYEVDVFPEDWDFSRQCRIQGVDVWATRAIGIEHKGTHGWTLSS